jgi:hypothetical protein
MTHGLPIARDACHGDAVWDTASPLAVWGQRFESLGSTTAHELGRRVARVRCANPASSLRNVGGPGQREWALCGPGRFVRTARSEVTDRMLILGQRHLRRTLDEYARHYTATVRIEPCSYGPPRSDRPVIDLTHERIKRRPVLGGLITEYERAA